MIGGLGSARASGLDATEQASAAAAPSAATPTTAPDFGPELPAEKLLTRGLADVFANRGALKSNIEDFRSAAAAAKAVATPLAVPLSAKPFGAAAVLRPGLPNAHASPAFVFRVAQYTDKVLIAYQNAKPGQDLTPRVATEIDGVPVPPELRGKIFVSGDPANRAIPWDAASELFERQLAAASGSDFLGGADVDGAKLTVVGHSQGGLDAANTRRRLEAQGKGDVIGRVVALNSPFAGSPIADETFLGLAARGLGVTGRGGRTPETIAHLDPDFVKSRFGPADRRLVDLAVTSTVDGPGSENVRPIMKGLAKVNKGNPLAKVKGPSDGFVTVASAKFGVKAVELPRAYDHAGVIEDPAVVDALAVELAKGRR